MTVPSQSTLLPLIVRTYFATVSAFEDAVGIHIARWRILYVLNEIGPCAQAEVSKRTHIDPAAMSRIVKDFEADGLIARTRSDSDARQFSVTLTAAGRRAVKKLGNARGDFLEKALSGFSSDEIDQLQGLLSRVQVNLEGPIEHDVT